MTAVMTSRAFDIPAGSGPAVLYVVRHAGLMPGFIAPVCPGCLETPVLDVLRLDTRDPRARRAALIISGGPPATAVSRSSGTTRSPPRGSSRPSDWHQKRRARRDT